MDVTSDKFTFSLFFVACTFITALGEIFKAEIGQDFSVPCPSGSKYPTKERQWAKGHFHKDHNPRDSEKIYTAEGREFVRGECYREDMTFNENNFSMTLNIQNGDENGNFTCITYGDVGRRVYETQTLNVYIQPVINMTTNTEPSEGKNLTVMCKVEKLYPSITMRLFTMTWARTVVDVSFDKTLNPDGLTSKYEISRTKTLTDEDNEEEITCELVPESGFGTKAQTSLVINYTRPAEPGESTEDGPNIGPIVAGAFGGLAVIIVVVLVLLFVMRQRRDKKSAIARRDSLRRQSMDNAIARSKTNKPATEGLMYAELDLHSQRSPQQGLTSVTTGSGALGSPAQTVPDVQVHRPPNEPTEYAKIDFSKLKMKDPKKEAAENNNLKVSEVIED